MGLTETALAFIDWFVPEKVRSAAANYGGSREVFRTRMVVLTALVVGVCLLLLTVARVMSQGPDGPSIWILSVSGMLMLALPFITRWTGSRVPATSALILMALIVLPMRTWSSGGLSSVVVAWYCSVPLFVWFAAGRKVGVLITVVCVAQLGFFWFAESWGFEMVSVGLTPLLRLISMTVLLSLLLFLALVSELERDAQVHDLRSLLSELGQSNEALERKSAEAEQAARAKAEFLASMSHELRTPLNGVMGMTQLLADSPLESEQASWVGTLGSSAQLLLTVINDVLDVSRLNDGMVELDVAPVQTRALVDEVINLLSPVATAKGLPLLALSHPDVPDFFVGDKVRLQQVLMNLLGNAIKFTSDGSVQIRTSWTPGEGSCGVLRFEVEDTGIGIEPSAQAQIFDWFSQADASTTRKYGGSGLGLTISTRLVALMGGSLGVHSGLGVGSTFWVDLPTDVAAEQPSNSGFDLGDGAGHNPSTARPAGWRVLVVEDNRVNQLVARRLLERLGCHVDVVDGGEQGLEQWSSQDYDLVFMDCEMPGMDGYETTRQLRMREQPSQHTPVVALTAHAMPEMVTKCLEAGMDGHLAKPLVLAHLEQTLERYISRTAA